MAAFAADVGHWYSTAAKLQRAADAAALAGVVWMPDLTQAGTQARNVIRQNGIDVNATLPDGTLRYDVVLMNPSEARLRVTITDRSAGRIFSQLLTNENVTIVRTSLAEYVRPMPLGSPWNSYGNDPSLGTDNQIGFWGSISSPYNTRSSGDPYAVKCLESTPVPPSCTSPNPDYEPKGYFYAVDVPAGNAGRTLVVEVYDAGNYAQVNTTSAYTRPSPVPGFDPFDTGHGRTSFQLLDEDATVLTFDDNPPIPTGAASASSTFNFNGSKCWAVVEDHADYTTFGDRWVELCRVTVQSNARVIYPLQVKTSAIPTLSDEQTPVANGINQFSLFGSVVGGTAPRVYAVNSMSVFANPQPALCPNGTLVNESNFFLAEVPETARNKKVTVSFFDLGDISATGYPGTFYIDIVSPDNAGLGGSDITHACTGSVVGELLPSCTQFLPRGATAVSTTAGCTFLVKQNGSQGYYNNQWVDISFVVPPGYTCVTDCWWKIRYRFQNVPSGLSPTDRATFTVRVSGDPVRVIS